jgi:hypothetical protein
VGPLCRRCSTRPVCSGMSHSQIGLVGPSHRARTAAARPPGAVLSRAARELIRGAKYHAGITRASEAPTARHPGLPTCRNTGVRLCPRDDSIHTHTATVAIDGHCRPATAVTAMRPAVRLNALATWVSSRRLRCELLGAGFLSRLQRTILTMAVWQLDMHIEMVVGDGPDPGAALMESVPVRRGAHGLLLRTVWARDARVSEVESQSRRRGWRGIQRSPRPRGDGLLPGDGWHAPRQRDQRWQAGGSGAT